MADKEWKGGSWKQEIDISDEATAMLARINAREVAVALRTTTRPIGDFISDLLELERKARFGGDVLSGRKLAVEAIRIHRTQGDFNAMLELLDELMRKRAQSKTVQTAMVAEASIALGDGAIYAETTAPPEGSAGVADAVANTDGPNPSGDAYRDMLNRLKFQCEGKIHLELEHARFCARLAALAVQSGGLREASDLLFGIQVETITNMPRVEKIRSVLNQLRMSIELSDDARFIVLSRKLNPRALGKEDTRNLKQQYFLLMAQYYERHRMYLPMARCWFEIFQTLHETADLMPSVQRERAAAARQLPSAFLEFLSRNEHEREVVPTTGLLATEALSNASLLALIAPHISAKDLDDSMEFCAFAPASKFANRIDLLKVLQKERVLETEVESMHRLIGVFLSEELIRVANTPVIADLADHHPLLAGCDERREALHARLSEHDLLVISRFYSRARIERLAELVGLPTERTERFIMDLVDAGELFARFDRVAGVVTFSQSGKPVQLLTDWTKQVEATAALVERAAQLISKERMVQASSRG